VRHGVGHQPLVVGKKRMRELLHHLNDLWVLLRIPTFEQLGEAAPARVGQPLERRRSRARQMEVAFDPAVALLDHAGGNQTFHARLNERRVDLQPVRQIGHRARGVLGQPVEQPDRTGRQVDARAHRQGAVELAPVIPSREALERQLYLLERRPGLRSSVSLALVHRLHGLAQLHLGEQEAQEERHEGDRYRDQEDDLDRMGHGIDVLGVEEQSFRRRLERGQHAGVDRLRIEGPQHRCRDLGQRRRDRVIQDDGVDRPEYSRTEGTSDHPEERGTAGGDAQVLIGHRVLHRDDQDLHDEAHADTENEHVAG
jgi:hypothetical protein